MTNETIIKNEQFVSNSATRQWDWWQLFAAIFMLSGLLAIVVAQVLTFLMWLFHLEIFQFSLQSITNLFFYVSFPLLLVGACCLDKVDENRRKKRAESNI